MDVSRERSCITQYALPRLLDTRSRVDGRRRALDAARKGPEGGELLPYLYATCLGFANSCLLQLSQKLVLYTAQRCISKGEKRKDKGQNQWYIYLSEDAVRRHKNCKSFSGHCQLIMGSDLVYDVIVMVQPITIMPQTTIQMNCLNVWHFSSKEVQV